MADVETLLARAAPRLKKDDPKARKLKTRLVKLAGAAWKRGPRRLKKLGVEVGKNFRPLDASADADAFLEDALDVLGEEQFVLLFKAVKKQLAKKLAEKKVEAPAAKTPKPKPASRKAKDAVPAELTMSDHDDGGDELSLGVPDSDEGLALPDDDGLSVPADDGGVPDLDLDNLSIVGGGATDAQPLGIRFGDGGGDAADQDDDDSDPALAADRALARYRRCGEEAELKRARDLYKRAVKEAKIAPARGAARGGLALTYLIEGATDKAKQHAKKALADFPSEPTANAVLCRADWPGEAEREKLAASLRRADSAVDRGDWAEAKAAAKALSKAYPKEPFAGLIKLAIACGKREDIKEGLAAAWKNYPPSEKHADVLMGPAVENLVAPTCLEWLADQIKEGGGKVLGQTVKDVEEKGNLVAAAFQLPLGLARAALAGRESLSAYEEQRLRLWIARSIFYSQHYDHAKEVFAGARKLDRESELLPEINKGETQCGVMKRSFDKPGVKHKMGKFDGVGVVAYRKAVANRLKRVLDGLDDDRKKLDAKEAALVQAILTDEGRKKKLRKRAQKGDQDDPFAQLDGLEDQAALADNEDDGKKKGGLFGRMKAAATKAYDKAKGAVAASKKKEALKALGRRLRDRPDGGWKDAELDAFLDKVEKIEPRLEFLEEEAEKARHAAGRAGDLS